MKFGISVFFVLSIFFTVLLFVLAPVQAYAVNGEPVPFDSPSGYQLQEARWALDSYKETMDGAPGFLKNVLGDELLRVHLRLSNGKIAIAKADVHSGAITDIEVLGTLDSDGEELLKRNAELVDGGERTLFTSALYLNQETVYEIAGSPNSQDELARQWGRGVKFEGLTPVSSLKIFFTEAAMTLYSFFAPRQMVLESESCPAIESIADTCMPSTDSFVGYYEAQGEDFNAMCDYLDQITPYSPYWAQTTCGYFYPLCTHHETKVIEKCSCECTATLAEPIVDPDIKIDLPEWTGGGYENASASQKAEWDRFISKLQMHEDGHVKIFNDGAADATKKLKPLKATAVAPRSCRAACNAADEKLLNAVTAIRQEVKAKVNEQTEQYDDETDHGKNQGTILNCSIT